MVALVSLMDRTLGLRCLTVLHPINNSVPLHINKGSKALIFNWEGGGGGALCAKEQTPAADQTIKIILLHNGR